MGREVDRRPGQGLQEPKPSSDPHGDGSLPAPGRASLGETVKAVAWSFLGVRRRDAHERDTVRLHPVAVILVGIALAALFVATLLLIVRVVVG